MLYAIDYYEPEETFHQEEAADILTNRQQVHQFYIWIHPKIVLDVHPRNHGTAMVITVSISGFVPGWNAGNRDQLQDWILARVLSELPC